MDFQEQYFCKLIETDLNKAKRYLIETTPDYLIKFYSLSDGCASISDSRLDEMKLNTIENNSNWADLPINQNDPLDSQCVISIYEMTPTIRLADI